MSSEERGGPERIGGGATRLAQLGAARPVRLLAVSAAALLLLLWSWPQPGSPIVFPDSRQYLAWPEPVKSEGVTRLGPRMPAYPLLLAAIGDGQALVHLQSLLSLTSWSLLGLVIGGWPGMVLGGLVSFTPEIRFWVYGVLTESPTLSLLALLIAIGTALAQCWRTGLMVVWSLGVCGFGLMRPSNLAILPFLLAPFVLQLHDLSSWRPLRSGLRPHGARLLLAVSIVGCVGLLGAVLAERSGFWRMNYYTAIFERVITDPQARAHFVRAGLPVPVRWQGEEFATWFDAHARRTYQGWVLGRGASYREAWEWMAPAGQREALRRKYVEPDGGPLVDAPPAAAAALIFDWLAPPGVLWLAVLGLALALPLRTGRLGILALWSVALAAGAYVQSFLTYHASAAEEMRHTLVASVMYRLSFALALAAIVERLAGARRAEPLDAGPARGSPSST